MSTLAVLGVRHHGPGSARSVLAALDELGPDLLLIEGPPELDALLPLAADPDLVPPVAGLVYAVDAPRRSAFYPFADFSPEWVALQWAVERGVPVRFADLPATHVLALAEEQEAEEDEPALGGPEDDEPAGAPHTQKPPAPRKSQEPRPDPVSMLAAAAGYDDPERWWEDVVEHRRGSTLERFRALSEAMAQVRATEATGETEQGVTDTEQNDRLENDRREAAMRRAVRAGLKEGRERIAFVCGAYHAPALELEVFPPASHDTKLLARLPRVKVAATWAPWSTARLALASGYGAGVRSPGWYQHLFREPEERVVPSWFVRVAHALREEELDASTASAVDASRLAEALATVRGRPSVGLSELTDAAQAVLAHGSSLPLQLIDRTLVVGEGLGSVPESTPMVPLAADLARQQRSLRLRPTASTTTVQLDLRREAQLARSVLLHRLALLGVRWGRQADAGRTTGSFKEAWELRWEPELSVAVVEASLWGTTVQAAAEARVAEEAAGSGDIATLGTLVEQCLLADLPAALRHVVAALAERTARQHDTIALLGTVEPLARTARYGDVRGVDVADVAEVLEAVVVRASVGLRAACSSLDDDAAQAARAAVESAHRGVALVHDDSLREPWHRALAAVAEDDAIHGLVAGRANRLLLDADEIDRDTAAARLSRHLSRATDGPAAAAWLDGFLAGEALLLLYGEDLLAIIDDWLASVPEEAFEDLLPLVRRTFARYQPAERRQIGAHLRGLERHTRKQGGPGQQTHSQHPDGPRTSGAADDLDLRLAAPAVATVARLLGLEEAS